MDVVDLTNETPPRPAAAAKGKQPDRKRQKLEFGGIMAPRRRVEGKWMIVEDETPMICNPEVEDEWQKTVLEGKLWSDPDFPPVRESIDGPQTEKDANLEKVPLNSEEGPTCQCGRASKRSIVQKDNENKGRCDAPLAPCRLESFQRPRLNAPPTWCTGPTFTA